jgi:hypothetical protein
MSLFVVDLNDIMNVVMSELDNTKTNLSSNYNPKVNSNYNPKVNSNPKQVKENIQHEFNIPEAKQVKDALNKNKREKRINKQVGEYKAHLNKISEYISKMIKESNVEFEYVIMTNDDNYHLYEDGEIMSMISNYLVSKGYYVKEKVENIGDNIKQTLIVSIEPSEEDSKYYNKYYYNDHF